MTEATPAATPATGRRLGVFINQDRVGTLHEDNDLWALTYDEQWVARESSFDLSPALPRSQLLHRDGATHRPVQWYFDNLLPEEKLRELIAADARLRDKDDAFALLAYLGAESAGSLTLLPPGLTPEGLDQAALAEAGKAACGETKPCGAWFWTDAANAPETAPDNHDGLNQAQVTSSLGVWVNEDQQLISITPAN